MSVSEGSMDDGARLSGAPNAPGEAPRFIRMHVAVILLVTLAVVVGAALVSWSRTPLYAAVTEVVVEPRSYVTGTAAQLPDMATEKALASSGTVLSAASKTLGVPQDQLAEGLSITVPTDPRVLRIAYKYVSPAEAKRRANGIAEAYVADANTSAPANQPHATIITPASTPKAPASPRHPVDLTVGFVLGLALGLGVALVRDRYDDSLRSPADFESLAGAPILGLIPHRASAATEAGNVLAALGESDPKAAAAYRDVRTRLAHIAGRQSARTILFTSPAGDDKSAVAANLATLLAMSGREVVLVFAEVRPPSVLAALDVEDGAGLSDVANSNADLAQTLRATAVAGLRVLTAGSRVRDPGAVLQTQAMRKAIETLRDTFDLVVFAVPPVLEGAYATVLAESVDLILLVGDARRTTRSDVTAATHQLAGSRLKLIGCVLDNAPKRRPWMRPRDTTDGADVRSGRSDMERSQRATWLADGNGRVRMVYTKVRRGGHADNASFGDGSDPVNLTDAQTRQEKRSP
jgi:polysaccharide biosynthesis transport protein